MKPTIGRIVIYRYYPLGGPNGSEFCPAVIVRVWTDTCVNLKLLEDGPENSWKTSVMHGIDNAQWDWPFRAPEPEVVRRLSDV